VLDYGAGRGAAHIDDACDYRRSLLNLRSKVSRVIGVDVDEAVRQNPSLDEAYVINVNDSLPLGDASIDLIVSDMTFEHLADPRRTSSELDRVLRPGGWLCARTPNRYGYIALLNRFTPDMLKSRVLNVAQPSRKREDVFPAIYLINTFRALSTYFPSDRFQHFSYCYDAEPGYHANSPFLFKSFQIIHYLSPPAFRSILMIFIKKRIDVPEIHRVNDE
jgi:SAM-dependent methyltransferase